MGLQQDIGFELARANAVQRRLQRLVAIRSLSPRLMPVATGVDRALYRITRGKVSVTATVVAFPTVMLTTTGARSGKPRVAPLAAIPVGDDLAVIGTSGGTGKTPGWVFNLRANGNASLSYKANVVQVIGREANQYESESAFEEAVRIYPGFADYRDRMNSSVQIFILTAATNGEKGES